MTTTDPYENLKNQSLADMLRRTLKFGGPMPIEYSMENMESFLQVIETMNLQKLTPSAAASRSDILMTSLPKPAGRAKSATNVKTLQGYSDNFSIRGGMSQFHIHYKDEVYLLNDKQAQEFSQRILAVCLEKLSNVKQIGFNDALALGSIVQNVTAK